MIEKIRKIQIKDPFILKNYYKDTILDIETTGLSKEFDNIFLIGTIEILPETEIKILTAENLSEEYELIKNISLNNKVITYNGDSFDLKFINSKLEQFKEPTINFNSFDLYKFVKQKKHLLNLERYRQVDIEKYLGIERDEFISGEEVAKNYREFLISKDYNLIDPIITHNLDDVHGLLNCLKIVEHTQNIMSFNVEKNIFVIDEIIFNGEFMEIIGNCSDNLFYFKENSNYLIEISNNKFYFKCKIHESYYDDMRKCKYVLKNKNSLIKNIANIPSPDTVQILYLNKPIYPNIKILVQYLFESLIR